MLFVLGSKHTQQQIDGIVKVFISTYQQLEGETLRHLMVNKQLFIDIVFIHF